MERKIFILVFSLLLVSSLVFAEGNLEFKLVNDNKNEINNVLKGEVPREKYLHSNLLLTLKADREVIRRGEDVGITTTWTNISNVDVIANLCMFRIVNFSIIRNNKDIYGPLEHFSCYDLPDITLKPNESYQRAESMGSFDERGVYYLTVEKSEAQGYAQPVNTLKITVE